MPILELSAGELTLITFAAIALFGVLAWFNLRKHIRGIRLPSESPPAVSPISPAERR